MKACKIHFSTFFNWSVSWSCPFHEPSSIYIFSDASLLKIFVMFRCIGNCVFVISKNFFALIMQINDFHAFSLFQIANFFN